MRVAGAAWVGACALALASSGAAALLHFLWSAPLSAAVAQPLPFLAHLHAHDKSLLCSISG